MIIHTSQGVEAARPLSHPVSHFVYHYSHNGGPYNVSSGTPNGIEDPNETKAKYKSSREYSDRYENGANDINRSKSQMKQFESTEQLP